MRASNQTICIVAFLGMTIGCAQAADIMGEPAPSYKDAPGNYWIVTVGGLATAEPKFPGSKTDTLSFIPVFDIHRAGEREWLSLPTDAISVTLYQTGNFRIGAAGDYILNRDRRDVSPPAAFKNIDYTLELGGFAEYYPVPFIRTRAELLQGVTGAEGLAFNLKADYILTAGEWLFAAGPRLQIVDTQYESTFFSTIAPPFHASGGLNTAGVDATAFYYVSDHLSVRAFADYERLIGDGADSPLVKFRGSPDQLWVGAGLAYRFTYDR